MPLHVDVTSPTCIFEGNPMLVMHDMPMSKDPDFDLVGPWPARHVKVMHVSQEMIVSKCF